MNGSDKPQGAARVAPSTEECFNLGEDAEWENLDEEIFRLRSVVKNAENTISIAQKIHTQFNPHLYFGVPVAELPEAAMRAEYPEFG